MNRRAFVMLGFAMVFVVGSTAAHAASTWPTVAGNSQRTGNAGSGPALRPLHHAWNAALDATVYAQPLVFNGRVYTATQNDTVYALDAHDGTILWKRHLGTPMTNVAAQAGCGNVDPLGILSTPVIDAANKTIYVVATIQDSFRHIHHQLIGLDTLTGIPRVSVNADPGGVQDPLNIQQRTGLTLANGRVYIGYGGYFGDCGPYHGWVVSLSVAGKHKVAFNVTPNGAAAGEGAIWAPGGLSVDKSGNVYAATGNPDPTISGNFGESVLKFDGTSAMHLTRALKTFPGGDNDLSSVSPAQLPDHLLFQIGKQHLGLLVDTRTMTVVDSLAMCAGVDADGADAWDGSHLYVPCNDGIQQVKVDLAHRSMSLGWKGPGEGSPMLAGGALWSVNYDTSQLYALSPATGAVLSGFPIAINSAPHFASPSAALGLLLIGTHSGVSAYAGPAGVPPHAPNACVAQKNHTGYWVAGSDGNVFPFGGAPSCGSLVSTHLTRPIVGMAGRATPGYWLVASDGGIFAFGTAKFHGSTGAMHLNKPIVGMAATASGKGYWLVASDGGIFSFGDAKFRGSTGAVKLNSPIVSMTRGATNGYWFVAGDGGVFAFGVPFHGSAAGLTNGAPAVAMAHD